MSTTAADDTAAPDGPLDSHDPRGLLIVGSGARVAARLAESCAADGWWVTTLVPEDPMAFPPTAWAPVEDRETDASLIAAVEAAQATIVLGGVGPVSAVVDDARILDVVLAHATPGSTLLALSSIAVFGDAGSRPSTEEATPDPPDELAPSRASEIRVLAANDWLRAVVLRCGLVYGDGGGALITQAVELARSTGVSRYFGEESDIIPTVHEDDLLALVALALDDPTARGTYHAVSGSTSVQGLAHLIAAQAGIETVQPWDDAAMQSDLGAAADVPRINVNSDVDRSRSVQELGWTPHAPSLGDALAVP